MQERSQRVRIQRARQFSSRRRLSPSPPSNEPPSPSAQHATHHTFTSWRLFASHTLHLENQRHGFRSRYTRNWIVGTRGASLAQVSTPLICTATVHMGVRKSFQPCSESVLGESSIRHNGPAAKRHQAWLRPFTRAELERTMPGNVVLHAHRLGLRRVLAVSHWCRRNSVPGLALKEHPSITQLAEKLSQGRPLMRRPRSKSCSMSAQGRARKVTLVLRDDCSRVRTSRACFAYLGPPALPASDSLFGADTCRCVSQPSL